jgi:hypothetical protein
VLANSNPVKPQFLSPAGKPGDIPISFCSQVATEGKPGCCHSDSFTLKLDYARERRGKARGDSMGYENQRLSFRLTLKFRNRVVSETTLFETKDRAAKLFLCYGCVVVSKPIS